MIQKIASIKLTFFSLALLLVLMGIGIFFSLFPAYTDAMESMNRTIIYHWFINSRHEKPVLTAWVLLISASSAILFVNTAFCSMTNQLYTAVKTASLRRWSFFIIHFLFLMVLACHGITMVTGHKQDDIQLCKGESHVFDNNYRIDVVNITFADDPKFLTMKNRESRHLMTRKKFSSKAEFCGNNPFSKQPTPGFTTGIHVKAHEIQIHTGNRHKVHRRATKRAANSGSEPFHHP